MNEEPKCVLCKLPLMRAGYLRNSGQPKTYIPTFYCDNNECERYGLVSVLKLKVDATPNCLCLDIPSRKQRFVKHPNYHIINATLSPAGLLALQELVYCVGERALFLHAREPQ